MIAYGDTQDKWIIEDWMPESTIAFVVSPPGSFKTWLLMDLAVSVASGMPFLNQYKVSNTGPVIIIQQEDHHPQTVERLALIAGTRLNLFNTSFEDDMVEVSTPPNLPIFIHPDRQLRFDRKESVEGFIEVVSDIKPSLVLIDPLYAAANTDDYMTQAATQMMVLKDLRDEFGTSFVIAHHRKKGGDLEREGAWGSQFLNAFLETGWQIIPKGLTGVQIKRHFKSSKTPTELELDFSIDVGERKYKVAAGNMSDGDDTLLIFQVLKDGPLNQVELANAMGVSKPTMSRRIKKWLADGLIVKDGTKYKLGLNITF